jgi:hypothetical protein
LYAAVVKSLDESSEEQSTHQKTPDENWTIEAQALENVEVQTGNAKSEQKLQGITECIYKR